MEDSTQIELTDPPSDGITKVTFGFEDNFLLASSWDGV